MDLGRKAAATRRPAHEAVPRTNPYEEMMNKKWKVVGRKSPDFFESRKIHSPEVETNSGDTLWQEAKNRNIGVQVNPDDFDNLGEVQMEVVQSDEESDIIPPRLPRSDRPQSETEHELREKLLKQV